MSIRRPSARIAGGSLVTIQPTAFGEDADGGRQLVAVGPARNPVPCRVHPSSSRDAADHMREEGVETGTIHFFSDPGEVKSRYLVNWLDYTPPRVLTALGPARTAAGDFSTWLVDYEWRQPPVPGQS